MTVTIAAITEVARRLSNASSLGTSRCRVAHLLDTSDGYGSEADYPTATIIAQKTRTTSEVTTLMMLATRTALLYCYWYACYGITNDGI